MVQKSSKSPEDDDDDDEKTDNGSVVSVLPHYQLNHPQNDNEKSKNGGDHHQIHNKHEIVTLNLEIAELRAELTKLELSKQCLEKELMTVRNGTTIDNKKELDPNQINNDDDDDTDTMSSKSMDEMMDDGTSTSIEPHHFVNNLSKSSISSLSSNQFQSNNNHSTTITTTTTSSTTTNTPTRINSVVIGGGGTDDDDELVLLSDPKVQNEEELIIYKEKYNDVSDENLKLKQDIMLLRNNYDHLKNKKMIQLLIYLSPLIVLIAYLLSLYL